MDELLKEIGGSTNELYKFHAGNYVNEESDSDSGDGTSKDTNFLNENLKPPPLALDEINQHVEDIFKAQSGNIGHYNNANKTKQIAKKLSLAIKTEFCFVCMQTSKRHYQRTKHYVNVMQWLQNELANASIPVNLNNFFCAACNLALCENDSAQKHYESRYHASNAKHFCLPCLRLIPEQQMPDHLISKKHVKDSLKISAFVQCPSNSIHGLDTKDKCVVDDIEQFHNKLLKSEVKEDNSNDEDEIENADTAHDKSHKNNVLELMRANNKVVGLSNEFSLITEYVELANILMDLLTPSFCYVCKEKANGSHYNRHEHNRNLEEWINSFAKNSGYYLENMYELICFACHAVFPSKRYADIHYGSSGHLSKARTFCNVCLLGLVRKEAVNHDKQPEHQILETKRMIEKETILKTVVGENRASNPTFVKISVPENTSISNFEIHGIAVNIVKAIIENKLDEAIQCERVPKSIIELLTPTYCFICNKSALKNNKGNFKHYTYMAHATELQKFIRNKADFELINFESLYCAACNRIFLNNNLALEHYNMPEHIENCDLCRKNGSNMHTSTLQWRQDQQGIIIAEKLKDMISSTFCFICKKYVNMHILNHHYLEREHIIKIRKWIENELRKSAIKIDKGTLYCEDCCLELGGTYDDLKHYATVSHDLNAKKYCSTCIFRGTPDEVIEHISSKDHENNLVKLSNDSKKENQDMWPEKLTKLMSYTECKICNAKLRTTVKADFHYCSESHNTKVKSWLHHYNKLVENTKNAINDKDETFCCTSCKGIFTSQQALNDHKNSHIPTLGDHNGHDARTSSKISSKRKETLKPQTQKALKKEKPRLSVPSDSKTRSVLLTQKKGNDKNDEYAKCHEEIRLEINKLIDAVYFVKVVPLEQSLELLRSLNEKLATYKSSPYERTTCSFEKTFTNFDRTNKTNETKKLPSSSLSTSYNDEIIELEFLNVPPIRVSEVTEQEYAKTKLSMELHRLKMVINNKSKVPSDLALKYVQNLNQLLKGDSVGFGFREFDIGSLFVTNKTTFTALEKTDILQDNIQDELNKLSTTLFDAKKISVELALEFITQFNVQLESFLQYQEGDDPFYFYISD